MKTVYVCSTQLIDSEAVIHHVFDNEAAAMLWQQKVAKQLKKGSLVSVWVDRCAIETHCPDDNDIADEVLDY